MTAEEKRERLLKRLLPALVITVIYFVFISAFIGEQKTKAEENLTKLNHKGVNAAVIPGINKQLQQSQQRITQLSTQLKDQQNRIIEMAGFLGENQSRTETSRLLAKILADNALLVTQESSKIVENNTLSPSIKEIKQWLQPDKKITAQHLEIRGHYFSMLKALTAIKKLKLQIVPLTFTMKTVEKSASNINADLEWELLLWM